MSEVTVVGGINLDTRARVIGAGARLGTSNPGRNLSCPGGVGRNVAECLARLGSAVHLVGQVGNDAAGDRLLTALDEVGVDASDVRRGPEPTGTYTAALDHDGELIVGVADMAATEAIGPEVAAQVPTTSQWLVVDGNLRVATVRALLERAAATGSRVALDPVGAAKAARLGALEGVELFCPNTEELTAWADTSDVPTAVARAHAQGVRLLWLREGRAGSTLWRADTAPVRVVLPPATVVDVTGAGDAMLAAYVHRRLAGDDDEAAAWLAAAAAHLTVTSELAVHPDLDTELLHRTLEALR